MSDIALVASVDFTQAEGQVNAFVERTKKKLSTIMAAATNNGGSLSGGIVGTRASSVGGARGTNGAPTSSLTSALRSNALDNYKREIEKIQALERAFGEGSIRWHNKVLQEKIAGLRRFGSFAEGNFRLRWAMEAEDARKAAQNLSVRSRAEAAAETDSANLMKATAETTKRIDKQTKDSLTANARAATTEAAKQADIEAAYAVVAHREALKRRLQENAAYRIKEREDRAEAARTLSATNTATKREISGFTAHVAREQEIRTRLAKDEASSGLNALRDAEDLHTRAYNEAAKRRNQIDAAFTASRAASAAADKQQIAKNSAWELAEREAAAKREREIDSMQSLHARAEREARVKALRDTNERTKREVSGFTAHVAREQEVRTRLAKDEAATGLNSLRDAEDIKTRAYNDAAKRRREIDAAYSATRAASAAADKQQIAKDEAWKLAERTSAASKTAQMEAGFAEMEKRRREQETADRKRNGEELKRELAVRRDALAEENRLRTQGSTTARSANSAQRTAITASGNTSLTFQNLSAKVGNTFGAGSVQEVAITGALNRALTDYIATINRYGTASVEAARKALEWRQAINDTKNAITAAAAATKASGASGVPFLASQSPAAQRADFGAVSGAEVAALGVSQRIGRQLGADPQLQEQLTQRLKAALDDYTRSITTYGSKSMEAARATDTWKKELTQIRSSIAENGGLLRTLNRNSTDLRERLAQLGGGFGNLSRLAMNTQVVLSSLMAVFGLREVTQAIQEFERFSATLRNVSGSVGAYQENLRFLYAEANRIGFAVGEVGNSFARLAVAMTNAGFTGNQTQTIFTGLSEAARNFGLTSADTMGVIRALEQSMSKGVFQAEEVRLQLGDRLPVAMAALRAAMEKVDGKVVDVNKRFEEGTIDVQRYAVEFVNQINRMSGGADTLSRTSNSIAAAFGRLSTEFTRSADALGTGGFTAAVVSVTNQITAMLESARQSGALESLGSLSLAVANNFSTLAGAVLAAIAVFAAIRVPMALVAFAAALSPVGIAIAAVTAAAAGMGAAYASSGKEIETATRVIQQAHSSSTTVVETSTARVAEANRLMERGIEGTATATDSYTDRIARSYARMGYSISESMRLALEDTKKAMEAQVVVLRQQLEEAATALRNAVDRQYNLRRVDQRIDGAIGAATNSAYGDGTAPADLTNFVRDFRSLVSIVRDGSEPLEVVGRAMGALNERVASFRDNMPDDDPYRAAFTQLSTIINDVVLALGRMNNADLTTLRNGVAGITGNLQTQLANIAAVNTALQTFGLNQNNDGPNVAPGTPGGAAWRAPNWDSARTSQQRSAQTWLQGALREVGLVGTAAPGTLPPRLGAAPELGTIVPRGQTPTTANSRTMLGALSVEANGGNAGAARILEEYQKKLREARTETGRLSDAVKELMYDMEGQTRAAGTDAGAATALAQAYRRLEDAAKSARGAINVDAERPRVEAEVYRRLAAERDKFVKDTARVTTATNRETAAWMQSAEAGEAAEIRTRAYAQALNYAEEALDASGNATGHYLEEVNRLTPAIRAAAQAERDRATVRQIDSNRDELAIIELETRLVGANTNAIQEEVAALRARQAARGASPDVVDAAERSARQLTTARLQSEQLQNSWQDLARLGEQAFDRIGSAITEAFAQGKISSISFAKIAKAMISEVIQAMLRLAVINPLLNSVFGGTRGTMGGLFEVMSSPSFGGFGGGLSAAGLAATGGAAVAGGGVAGGVGSAGGGFFSSFGSGNGLGMFSSIGNGINDFASFATGGLFAPSAATATNTALAGMGGGMMGPATESAFTAAGGGGATFGSALGAIGGGFAVGSMVGSMVAGDSQHRQTNSMIGAGGGALAGFALGGPVGALIGGALGGAGGGLLGPGNGFKGGDALIGFDENGMLKVTGYAGKNFDQQAELMAQAKQQTAEVNARLKALGLSFTGRSGEGEFAFAIGGGESANPTDIGGAMTAFNFGGKSLTSSNRNVMTAIGGDKSIEQAMEAADWVLGTFEPLTDTTGAYAQSIKALTKTFDEALEKTRELGLSEAELANARSKAFTEAAAQRDAQLNAARYGVASRSLRADGGIYNNREADLLDLSVRSQAEVLSYRKTLEDLSLSAEEVAVDMGKLAEVQAKERAAIYEKYESDIRTWVSGTYNVLTKQTNSFALSLAALNDQFDAAGKIAKELGYSEATLNAARQEAAADLYAARDSQVLGLRQSLTVRNLRLDGTDASNQTADLMEFDLSAAQEKVAFKKTMFDLGMTSAEISAEMIRLEQTLGAERLSIIKKYSDAIAATERANREAAQKDATSMLDGMSDYIRRLRTGDTSPLDAQAQYRLASSEFGDITAKAAAGDANAMAKLTDYADIFIAASRNLNGSGTTYVQDFDRVISALEQVADQGPDSLTASFLARTTENQTTTLVESLNAVKEEITALRREVRQQATTPGRVS